MTEVVETAGWDGEWFRRAYDYFGTVVGSSECEEGQIFIEPQGICVVAGIGLENGLADKALASVRERLATPHGIVLHQPAYTYYHLELGEISTFPQGYKENAGVFCHTNPWVMIAEARAGNGEGALDYYLRINPSAREEISDVHRCEPYVYAQMIAGQGRPDPGRGQELVADGHGRLELRGHQPVDPRHPAPSTTGCASTRCCRADWGEFHGHAPVPRRHVRDHRPQGRGVHRPGRPPGRRRARGGGQPGPAAVAPWPDSRGGGLRPVAIEPRPPWSMSPGRRRPVDGGGRTR